MRAGSADDRAEAVDFFFRVRPKGEAVGVAAMARFLVETDERRSLVLSLGVIGDLGFRDADLRKTQRRKEYIVKFSGFREVGHAKVNVIEAVDTHMMMFATNSPPPPLATVEPEPFRWALAALPVVEANDSHRGVSPRLERDEIFVGKNKRRKVKRRL